MSYRNVSIATLATASMLLGAQTASAHSGTVDTTDAAPGGRGYLIQTGGGARPVAHYVRACDRQRDGRGVKAYVSWTKNGPQNGAWQARAWAGRGSGTCESKKVNTGGRDVYLTVCLTNGKSFCRTKLLR